jgi:hypothetical protein
LPWDQLVDNEEPIVWHEPILNEYWGRLDETINWRKQEEIVTEIHGIEIKNIEMKKERLAGLVAIFRNGGATNSSTYLYFYNANLCEEGIVWLSKLVDVSSNLQEFCLHHNRIDNMDSARCLSRTLKSLSGITHLWLTHCDLGSTPEILSVILQSDVKNIFMDNNNIDSLGVVKIAEYLEGNPPPPIKQLSFNHNLLNDNDAILMSQALKRNRNLSHLHLERNNITSIGVKAILSCVFDSSSLNAISESNHTLERMIFFDDKNSFSHKLEGCIGILLELDRAQKISLALQDKDSLLQYLANVPVGLIPDVLAFPH